MSEGWAAAPTWQFVESEDGGLSLVLNPPHPLFAEAFLEAVGPWALVDGEEVLSTYWVDRLIGGLEGPAESPGVEQRLADASGSELFRLDDHVLARDTIFDVPDETLTAAEVLPALYAWRQELLRRGASSQPPDEAR